MKEEITITRQLKKYLQWPLYLSVLVLAMDLVVCTINTRAGLVMFGFTAVYLMIALTFYFYKKKGITAALYEYASQFSLMQQMILKDMQIPYLIADEAGNIIWKNNRCQEILDEGRTPYRNLAEIFPAIDKKYLKQLKGTDTLHEQFQEHAYQIELKYTDLQDSLDTGELHDLENMEKLLTVSLLDETEILACRREIYDEKPVYGLIYVDNYEEALNSVEEVRGSLLTALIDRKINRSVGSMGGIVKKLEKDKYFFTIKQKYVEDLRKQRFSLLEDVKTVNVGNDMALTLSIALGMGGDSYAQNYNYAQMAMDMALGRGGDQAVIKNGNQTEYFGGKSQQQEKTTRVKARVKALAMRELMENKDRLLIMGHRLPDIDAFGSAVGIYRIAAALDKRAHIILNEETASIKAMVDKFHENPDYPEDMIISTERAKELVDQNTMLVVVDVNRPSITEAPELLKLVKTIVVLDHHRQSSEIISNAVLSYVEPFASSACEMVAEVVQYITDGIRLRPLEADAMYAGIVVDTNNFMNQAGVRTFEAAAYLRRCGADITRVRKMFRDDLADYQAKAEAIRLAEVYEGSFAISVCPAENVGNPTVVAAQAANELLAIQGIKASVVMCRYNNLIYISARSIDEVNVQVMMEKLGGGGHRTIAGAQLPGSLTTEEAKTRIREVIRDMIEKGDI